MDGEVGEEPKESSTKVVDPPKKKTRFVDHPVVAWLLENGCIMGVTGLRWLLPQPHGPHRRPPLMRSTLETVVGGLVLIEGSIFVQKMLVDRVYSHIPFFSEAGRQTSQAPLGRWLREWATCNLPGHLLAAFTVSLAVQQKRPLSLQKARPARRSGPLFFLLKLAVARVATDIAFYAVHRALHTRFLYGLVHKRHHEHKATALLTNFHFTVSDLVLEGFLPLFFALATLEEGLKIKSTPFETMLITAYIEWYEIGSHSGKPMPTVTYFPPLAPFYQRLLGNVDARNVEFHNVHHARTACNYGITQWVDHALGTARFAPGSPGVSGEAPALACPAAAGA